jgi:cyanate permease
MLIGAKETRRAAWALSSITVPTNCTASIGAMQNFGGYLGGALAPTVTGLIVQSTGSFVMALVVGAVIGVVSAASYLFVVRDVITEVNLVEIAGLHTAGNRCEVPTAWDRELP